MSLAVILMILSFLSRMPLKAMFPRAPVTSLFSTLMGMLRLLRKSDTSENGSVVPVMSSDTLLE